MPNHALNGVQVVGVHDEDGVQLIYLHGINSQNDYWVFC